MNRNKFAAGLTLGSLFLSLTTGCGSPAAKPDDQSTASVPPASSQSAGNNADTNGALLRTGTISRRPDAITFSQWQQNRGADALLLPMENGCLDLRSADLRGVDLSGKTEALLHTDFDSLTLWPSSLPGDVSPAKLMALGTDPGLDLRSLHQRGITGKGVGIAIIDQTLLTDHQEYGDRLRLYQEYNIAPDEPASMHGAAVSSIALGKTVGVAPEASLYFIADILGSGIEDDYVRDMSYYAQDIDHLITLNETLPREEKIRVISISAGYQPNTLGAAEFEAAITRARSVGIAVCYVADNDPLMNFFGMGRKPYGDPNDPASWRPGQFWEVALYSGEFIGTADSLLVPMDRRTVASFTGPADYSYYSSGGASWTVPYMAGLYALACQVKPGVTFEEFLKTATETASPLSATQEGKTLPYGQSVNPAALLKKLS